MTGPSSMKAQCLFPACKDKAVEKAMISALPNATIITVNGMRLPASENVTAEKALLAKIDEFYAHRAALNAEYHAALPAGGKALRQVQNQLLTSFAVKFVAALAVTKRIRVAKRHCLTDLAEIAHGLTLNKQSPEPVWAWQVPKSSSGWRTLQKFAVGNKSAQQIGRDLLGPYVNPRPWQYDFEGVHAAISAVANAITSGRPWMAHSDIQSFYPSFNRKEVRNALKSPKSLTDFYLVGEFLNVQALHQDQLDALYIYEVLSEARKGVPQGSSVSPHIAVTTISHMPWEPPAETTAVFYGDNMGLLCATEAEATAHIKALRATVEALPTGDFKTKLVGIDHASDGFDFLGVHFALDDQLTITPTTKNHKNFHTKLHALLDDAYAAIKSGQEKEDVLDAIGRFYTFAASWLSAFQLCTNIAVYEKEVGFGLGFLTASYNCSVSDVQPFVTKDTNLAEFVSG